MQKKIYFIFLTCLLISFSASAENWFYTFKKGDTVWDFGHSALIEWQHWDDIVTLNKITNDHYMKPGMQIAIPMKWLKQRESKISVRKITGQVTVQLDESSRTMILKPGMRISLGDSIHTKENSTIQLIFEDGTKLTLLEKSTLILVSARMIGGDKINASDIKARIIKGRVNIHANPDKQADNRFEILTVAGNSAVRGTKFRVNADQTSTMTEVLTGKILVSNPQGHTDLTSGFGTIARVGEKPLAPIVLLDAPNIEHLPRIVRYLPESNKLTDAASKATAYRLQVLKKSEPELILIDQISKQNVIFSQLLSDGDYIVKLRAIDENGLEGKTAQYAMQIDARPEAPFQQQPKDTYVQTVGDINFKWSEPENIKQYLLELSTQESFQDSKTSRFKLLENKYTRTIEEPGNYYWRISSIDNNGKIGPPSNSSSLVIVPKPEHPEMEKPAIDEHQLLLKWRDAGSDMHYKIQFSNDSDFSLILIEQTITQAQFSLDRPASGTYYFRVQTISSEGFSSAYSPTQKINVPVKSYWPAGIASLLFLLLAL